MLETTRQYVTEHSRENATWSLAADRHRDYFLAKAEDVRLKLGGPEQNLWFQRIEAEHDNYRAALDWCRVRNDGGKAVRLAVAIARFWDTFGHVSEGRLRLDEAMKMGQTEQLNDVYASAHVHAGWMATIQRDCTAAREHYELALPYFEQTGDETRTGMVLNCLGSAALFSGDFSGAQVRFEQSLEIFRRCGRKAGVATVLSNLGEVELHKRDCNAAREYLQESIVEENSATERNPEQRGLTLCNLAIADLFQERFSEAQGHVISALKLFRESAAVVAVPSALDLLAVILSHLQEWERAGCLFGAAEGLAASQGIPSEALIANERSCAKSATRSALSADGFKLAYLNGQQLTLDEAVNFALAGEAFD
jgi:non-specific serine/threonine protein kinase